MCNIQTAETQSVVGLLNPCDYTHKSEHDVTIERSLYTLIWKVAIYVVKWKSLILWKVWTQDSISVKKDLYIYMGTQKTPKFICKKCVFILTCLNFSHLQSTLHWMWYTYWDVFPLLKTVFELINSDAFLCFCRFLFHLFHTSKTFPFEAFLSGETKKVLEHSPREGSL